MIQLVENKRSELAVICAHRGVRRLMLFGSAATGRFDAERSDLDFLVEFEPQAPARRADSYFGLMEDLQQLFGMPVDLVEPGPITNPYFREAVEKTQVLLYAAA
jgi:predicted nucleotidyltransferase